MKLTGEQRRIMVKEALSEMRESFTREKDNLTVESVLMDLEKDIEILDLAIELFENYTVEDIELEV